MCTHEHEYCYVYCVAGEDLTKSSSNKATLHFMFNVEVRNLKSEFANLQAIIQHSIESSASHQMLIDLVRGTCVLSDDHQVQIIEATVDDIFIILTTYLSFIDYEPLERIVETVCPDVKEWMEQYVVHLEQFCRRKVSEIPSDPLSSNVYNENKETLSFKVDEEDLTLMRVKQLKRIVAEILLLNPFELLLYSCVVQEGCVLVACVMFRSVGEKVFEKKHLTELQQDHFRKAKITSLQFKSFKACFNKDDVVDTQLKPGRPAVLNVYVYYR